MGGLFLFLMFFFRSESEWFFIACEGLNEYKTCTSAFRIAE